MSRRQKYMKVLDLEDIDRKEKTVINFCKERLFWFVMDDI